MMMLFDSPDAVQGLGQRSATTVAPQALALMNHPQVLAYAAAFAKRLLPAAKAIAGRGGAARLRDGRCRGRRMRWNWPAFGASICDGPGELETALTDFCQTSVALNEFIYVE